MLLTCVELCLLGDAYSGQEGALRLMSMLMTWLHSMRLAIGGTETVLAFQQPWWRAPQMPTFPLLQQLSTEVLDGLVSLVVPAVLPSCHTTPLPSDLIAGNSELSEFEGTVAALLPQQITILSIQGRWCMGCMALKAEDGGGLYMRELAS